MARPRVLADAHAVRSRVAEMGAEIGARHPDGCVLVGVLTGSVVVVADLARAIPAPVLVDFVAVTSYRPDAGRVRLVKDLDVDVTDRAVVLVHDVVHTGLTTAYLTGELGRRGASSVEVCALVDRRGRRVVPVEVHTAGFVVGDEFVVGMGLDHGGRFRNLDALLTVDERAREADLDALSGDLHGGSGARAAAPSDHRDRGPGGGGRGERLWR